MATKSATRPVSSEPWSSSATKFTRSREPTPSTNQPLEVTTDELLRSNGSKPLRRKPSRRVLRRMERIQDLPPRRQYFVLKALDALLSSSAKLNSGADEQNALTFFPLAALFYFQQVNGERCSGALQRRKFRKFLISRWFLYSNFRRCAAPF
jgi:hypothetical protein